MLPKLNIIYASTSGNVLTVCERISEYLSTERIESELLRAETTGIEEILTKKYFIFATSTWEHGVINPYFKRLLNEMGNYDLSGKYAGFVGLGDTRYEPVHFCKGIDILEEKFLALGGRGLATKLKINGDPYPVLETLVKDWSKNFSTAVKKYEN